MKPSAEIACLRNLDPEHRRDIFIDRRVAGHFVEEEGDDVFRRCLLDKAINRPLAKIAADQGAGSIAHEDPSTRKVGEWFDTREVLGHAIFRFAAPLRIVAAAMNLGEFAGDCAQEN